ncbi:MAG: MBL fold metallo-hydrolase [Candidatus Diapherotrites archaeon]
MSETNQIAKGLYALISTGESSNCFLLKGEKNALVDSGLEKNSIAIKDFILQAGLQLEDINFIFHTHAHCDHFQADMLFPKAEILASKEEAEKLNGKDYYYTASELFASNYFPEVSSFLKGGQEIKLKPFKLKVISTPGHTKGGLCFYEPGLKALFSGDTVFNGAVGRSDLIGGNKEELVESLKKLSKLKIEFLLPGHGEILEGAEENKKNLENAINLLI